MKKLSMSTPSDSRRYFRRLTLEALDARLALSAAGGSHFIGHSGPEPYAMPGYFSSGFERFDFSRVSQEQRAPGGTFIASDPRQQFGMPPGGLTGGREMIGDFGADRGGFEPHHRPPADGAWFADFPAPRPPVRPNDGGFVDIGRPGPPPVDRLPDVPGLADNIGARPQPPVSVVSPGPRGNDGPASPLGNINASGAVGSRGTRASVDGGFVDVTPALSKTSDSGNSSSGNYFSISNLLVLAATSPVLELRSDQAAAQAAGAIAEGRTIAVDRGGEGGLIAIGPAAKADDSAEGRELGNDTASESTPSASLPFAETIDEYWRQFGEALKRAKLPADADDDRAETSELGDAPQTRAGADLFAGDGGLIELSAGGTLSFDATPATGDRKTALPIATARDIKLDSAVALFQAFELETAPAPFVEYIAPATDNEVQQNSERADSGEKAEAEPPRSAAAPAAAMVLFALGKNSRECSPRKKELQQRPRRMLPDR